jgi:PAS domain S-box-containing protein
MKHDEGGGPDASVEDTPSAAVLAGEGGCAALHLPAMEAEELIRAGADWVWETDADLRFSWLSAGYREITGIDPADVLGRFRFDFLNSDERSGGPAAQHLDDLQARRPFRDFVYALKGARSDCGWISVTGFPRFDDTGCFLGYRGTARNITRIVQALDESDDHADGDTATMAVGANIGHMMSALNVMSDAFCYYDAQDRLRLFNAAMVAMYRGLEDVIQPGLAFAELVDEGLRRGIWNTGGVPAAQWREAVLSTRLARSQAPIMIRFADGRTIMHRGLPSDAGGTVGICTDITELENQRSALDAANRQSEYLLSDLQRTIDSLDLGVVLLGADLNAEIINKAFYVIWNLEPDSVAVGSPFRALMDINRHNGIYDVADDEWEAYVASRTAEIRAGDVAPREFARADGKTMVYSVTALSGGKRLVSYFDVTEMKERERSLHESMRQIELFRHVLDELPVAANIKAADLTVEYVNKAWCALTGFTPEQAVGRTDRELFGVGEADGFSADDAGVVTSGSVVETEEAVTHLDGTLRQLMTRKSRVVAGDGTVHVCGSSTDITDIKRREALLRESLRENEVFRGLIDNVPVAIYAKKEDLKLTYVNKGWCDLTGFSKDFAIGRTDVDIFGADGELLAEADRAVFASGELREIEETVTSPDGSLRHQVARKGAFTASDGSLYLIGSTVDVTEQKRREGQLREAERRAVLADRAKSEFLANMSHEIRTPMNGVLGMAELLARTELDSKQKTFTDIIVKSGNALLTIINDILDFSKIDAGELVLDPAPFNLPEAIEDVATLLSTRAKEKDLELIVRLAPDLNETYVGDVGRIRQIVTNLVGNAIKFTEAGHVLVEAVADVGGGLRVAVTDTGIGIPADKRDLVFEKFSQVDASSTRRHEGTGLGLAITSRLVEMMGGSIGVDSAEGKGSTFWFTLRLPSAERLSEPKWVPVDVTGARILVVDDNPVNRAILLEQMASWRFDACAASSGAEGLEVLRAVSRLGLAVDCLVLDYQMPGMSGLDMARAIRATTSFAQTPIVMLTSVDQSLGTAAVRDLLIDAQLTKPARSSLLLETLVTTIQRGRHRRGTVAPEPRPMAAPAAPAAEAGPSEPDASPSAALQSPSAVHRVDILVAEDNEVNQLVFTQILSETGMTFQIVGNGRLAVEAVRDGRPRMVLMDVSMPEMNGMEATGAIRALEAERGGHTPIIGVTAHALKGDRERCLEAGMDDYLPKPISPKALQEKIARWAGIVAGRQDQAASG